MRRALLTLMLGLSAAGVLAAVTVGERVVEGQRYVVVRTDSLEALVAPQRGGQIVSLVHLKSGQQVGNAGSLGNGLFSDHDVKQSHPGELMGAVYEATPGTVTAAGAVMTLTRLAEGGWRNEVAPGLKDLRFEKTYSFTPAAPLVRMRMKISNTSAEDRLADYWVQSIAHVGTGEGRNYFYRPSSSGIAVTSNDNFTGRGEYVLDFTDGWSAAINRKLKLGLVYLVDYDYLDRLYNCATAFTQEFMYQRVPLPPGKSWETELQLRVVEGFGGVTHASGRVIAETQTAPEAQTLRVIHRLAAWEQPLTNVRIETALRDAETQLEKKATAISLPSLGQETVSQEVAFDSTEGGLKVVVVTVSSDQGTDRWELPVYPYGGAAGSYRKTPRPQQVTLPRPDNLPELWRQAKQKPAGLLQLGDSHYAEDWRLEAAAKRLGLAYTPAKYTPAAVWRDASLYPFPISHAQLFPYDVVVLADGDAKALRRYGAEMLRDYVAQGGGVLFLGGHNSLGKGSLEGSPVAELLPVQTLGRWDLRKAGDPQVRSAAGAWPWLAEALAAGSPRVDWYQEVTLKPEGQVQLSVDGKPLLVAGSYGKGRVAVYTGTVYGEKGEALPAWSGYPGVLDRLLRWVKGEG